MDTEQTFSCIRRYVDTRLEEARLKAADGISSAVSQLISWLIIAMLLVILVCILDVALMQWLNGIIGQPYGTLAAAGVPFIAIIMLFLLRKRLFAGTLGKNIAGALGSGTDNVKSDLAAAESERRFLERKLDESKSGIISDAVSGIVFATAIIRRIRKALKSD